MQERQELAKLVHTFRQTFHYFKMLSISTILRAIAVALFISGNVAFAAPVDNVDGIDLVTRDVASTDFWIPK